MRAPAAQFVHIDQDRPTGARMIAAAAGAETAARYGRSIILNIWRTLTPPAQDVPLALCDQRTLDEADWVLGRTIEPYMPDPTPYLSSVFTPRQSWYYFSDMSTNEALVFKNYDSRIGMPLGSLHSAFKLPGSPANAVPRASAETRIVAFFD